MLTFEKCVICPMSAANFALLDSPLPEIESLDSRHVASTRGGRKPLVVAPARANGQRMVGRRACAPTLHGLEARLCRWLLETHDCMDGNVIPLTQEFLGEMLGVRRTTVTIAARLLQSGGVIRYRRGLIQIVDRPKLEELSRECYAVVRRYMARIYPPQRAVDGEPSAYA